MKAFHLLPALLVLPWTMAQQQDDENAASAALTTETLTMLDASGSTLTATMTQVESTPTATTNQQHTATTSSQPTAAMITTNSPSEAPITSVLQATRTESGYVPTASSATNLNPDGVDVEGGASGSSSGGFSLSTGGMIAIIIVVVGVAIFGGEYPTNHLLYVIMLTTTTVLSITLFMIAKKRQWRVRESIKRASRRLTGRPVGPRPRSEVDRRKRSGVVAGARRAPPGTPLVQQKRTAVSATELADLEKGDGAKGEAGKGWLGMMRGNNWK